MPFRDKIKGDFLGGIGQMDWASDVDADGGLGGF
jgi:hypothetical protein